MTGVLNSKATASVDCVPIFRLLLVRFPPFGRSSDGPTLRWLISLPDQQVREGSQHAQSILVLGQAAVADLGIAEHSLDVEERMLDLGPHRCFQLFSMRLWAVRVHGPALARSCSNEVFCFPFLLAEVISNTPVTRVTEDPLPFAMQQLIDDPEIMSVGGGRLQTVDQAQGIVDANVHLHLEVPLLAFSCLVHLRVSLALLVLGRAGRVDDAGIDNRAFAQHQPLFLQVAVHLLEDLVAELVAL